jgi:ketosteroid isomerase-like protein
VTARPIEQLMADHDAAWAARSLDAIVALHHPEGSFRLVGSGDEVHGRAAIREAFAATLAHYPDIAFETRRTLVGEGFFVQEATISGTPARPEGAPLIRFDSVDVITVRDGLLLSKVTYVDGDGVRAQLRAAGGKAG